MDKTLDLDELERVAREVADGANALLAMCNVPLRVCAGDDVPFATAKRILTLIAAARPAEGSLQNLQTTPAARPAVVSDEVVERMVEAFADTVFKLPPFVDDAKDRIRCDLQAALALLPCVEGEGSR